MVLLPLPLRPVNQTVAPFWPSRRLRSARVMSPSCQWTFVAFCSVIVPSSFRDLACDRCPSPHRDGGQHPPLAGVEDASLADVGQWSLHASVSAATTGSTRYGERHAAPRGRRAGRAARVALRSGWPVRVEPLLSRRMRRESSPHACG